MQQRRGTASQWTSADPILAAGEIGYETDTGKFKIGNGSSIWSALNYYVDANAILDGAPGVLDTLNELAASLGDDPAFFTTVANNLSDHTDATTNVHGIADTNDLATKDYVNNAISGATVDQSALAGTGIDWNSGTEQFDIDNTVVTLTGTQTLTNKTLTGADLGSTSVAVTQTGTDNTTKIATTEFVQGRINAVVAGAPELLNTLNELSLAINNDADFAVTLANDIATKLPKSGGQMTGILTLVGAPQNGDDAATKEYVDNTSEDAASGAVSTHNALTTNVHGIDDVGELVTNSVLSEHTSATTDVHGITDTAALATKTYADNAVETHRADTTNVHGIVDTAALVLTDDARLSDTRTPTDNTVTTAKIVNSNVTADKLAGDSVTTAKILDGAVTSAKIADGAIVNADINASAAIDWTKLAVSSTVSATELGYVDGVTSAIQTQLDSKLASTTAASTYAPIASPTFTGTVSGVTKSMVGLGNVDNTSDANKPVSTATQTALDLKANIASPTFTGTVSGITKSMVGLGNVDNTSDANKPVSTATQTALDAKLSLAGGTMTGALTLSGAPTSDLHAATKAYVDGISAGINFHQAVVSATSGNLAGVYNNGTNGYGATITASANGSIGTIDGATVAVGDRILLRAQTDATQNGIYVVSNLGSGSTKWVVTRAADADNNPTGELATGDFCFVTGGNTYPNTGFILSTSGTITVGTTNVTYTQFNAAQAIVAGTGLSKVGSTISIDTATTVDLSTAQTLSNKTFVAPVLGAATATSINGTTIPSSKTLVTTADSGTVTSTMIADGTIVDADINASAAIAQSKISGLSTSLGLKANLAAPSFTGGVTVDSSGIIFTDGTQTKEGVPSRTPIIQKTAAYTLGALTERDSLIEVSHTGASAVSVTIPADSTLNFPVGTSIDVLQTNTGAVAIAAGAGVTVNATPGLTLRTQWSSCTLLKRAANTWVVYGDLK